MKQGRTHIVLNPASSGGKTARRQDEILREIRARLAGIHTVCVTTRPFEATISTRAAIHDGAELIIVVGGDGTIHEVLNGFTDEGKIINPFCQFGIVCSGTAQDAAKSFQLPSQTRRQIEIACGDRYRPIDIGKVIFTDARGKSSEQLFMNECQQGIAAVVVQRFQDHHKWLGGFLGFGITAVATAARHREQLMSVSIDGRHVISDSLLGVVVANGAYAGGGMNFAPRSRVDDGLLDIIFIHKQSVPSRLWNFPKIYFGAHISLSWISYYQGRHIEISSDETVPVEADGELLGSLPCAIGILPGALKLKSDQ